MKKRYEIEKDVESKKYSKQEVRQTNIPKKKQVTTKGKVLIYKPNMSVSDVAC